MQEDRAKERHARSNGKVRHKGPSSDQNAARERARDMAERAGPDALEVVPFGRSVEEHEALLRKKAKGRAGGKGCLLYLVAFALFAVWVAGYESGRSYQPSVNDSAVIPTQQRKDSP